MKLFLSSYRLGDDPELLADLFGENKRVAIVMNATDIYSEIHLDKYLFREKEDLATVGLIGEDFDLRNWFGKPGIEKVLDEFGGVWVLGGNSFVLRRAMSYSGFDGAILDMVDDFVYAGYSAGAVVAGTELNGIHLIDAPEDIPAGYEQEIIWEGLELVDFTVAPHYRSNHNDSAAVEYAIDFMELKGIAYKPLRDGEVIIC